MKEPPTPDFFGTERYTDTAYMHGTVAIITRKSCCRKETARCRSRSFRFIRQYRTVDTGRRAACSIISIAVKIQIAAISLNVCRSSRTTVLVLQSDVESSGA